MTENTSDGQESSVSCPSCEEAFDTRQGMRVHHKMIHGESLTYTRAECSVCGSEVKRRKDRMESHDAVLCSNECNSEWSKTRLTGPDHPNWKKPVVTECAYCGEELIRNPNYIRGKWQFCNHSCYGAFREEEIVGEDHPLFKGGSHDYGPGWTESKRARVRERDNHKCQGCGMDQHTHRSEYGVKLHVHHKTPARQFNDPDRRNDPQNLVTLCCECHKIAEQMAPLYPFAE